MGNTVDLFTNFIWTLHDHFESYLYNFRFVYLFSLLHELASTMFFLDPDQTLNEENVGVYIMFCFSES